MIVLVNTPHFAALMCVRKQKWLVSLRELHASLSKDLQAVSVLQSKEGSLRVLWTFISSFLSAMLPEKNDNEVRSCPPLCAINHYFSPRNAPVIQVNLSTLTNVSERNGNKNRRVPALVFTWDSDSPTLNRTTDSRLLKQLLYSQHGEGKHAPGSRNKKFIDNIKTNIKRCHAEFKIR